MDYRFRANKLTAQFISKGQVKQKVDSKMEKDQISKDKLISFGPTNLTEYLFADKYGDINQNINSSEINTVYMSYMQSLIDSYERLKSKFNQLQTKCLSEK